MIFSLEVSDRLKETRANIDHVRLALHELKSKKIKKILEVSLAVGNYLNSGGKNARDPAQGFRVASLLKMTEVVSPKTKQTLLHFIIKQLQASNNRGVLSFYGEIPHVSGAVGAVSQFQVEQSAIAKDLSELEREVEALRGEAAAVLLVKALETTVAAVKKELEALSALYKEVEEDVKYFGEPNADELAAFFTAWLKFAQAVQKAVNHIEVQEKRAQKELEKEKEKEAAARGKRKTVESIIHAKKEDKKLVEGKEQAGIVEKVSKSLRDKDTFTKIRSVRKTVNLSEDASPAAAATAVGAAAATAAAAAAAGDKAERPKSLRNVAQGVIAARRLSSGASRDSTKRLTAMDVKPIGASSVSSGAAARVRAQQPNADILSFILDDIMADAGLSDIGRRSVRVDDSSSSSGGGGSSGSGSRLSTARTAGGATAGASNSKSAVGAVVAAAAASASVSSSSSPSSTVRAAAAPTPAASIARPTAPLPQAPAKPVSKYATTPTTTPTPPSPTPLARNAHTTAAAASSVSFASSSVAATTTREPATATLAQRVASPSPTATATATASGAAPPSPRGASATTVATITTITTTAAASGATAAAALSPPSPRSAATTTAATATATATAPTKPLPAVPTSPRSGQSSQPPPFSQPIATAAATPPPAAASSPAAKGGVFASAMSFFASSSSKPQPKSPRR